MYIHLHVGLHIHILCIDLCIHKSVYVYIIMSNLLLHIVYSYIVFRLSLSSFFPPSLLPSLPSSFPPFVLPSLLPLLMRTVGKYRPIHVHHDTNQYTRQWTSYKCSSATTGPILGSCRLSGRCAVRIRVAM